MTCWRCKHEQSGAWQHCQRCGALSLANAEAVARGVASCAVRVRVRECRVNGCENVWRANTNGAAGHKHPTRHGAALAAFEAAWAQGKARLQRQRVWDAVEAMYPGTCPPIPDGDPPPTADFIPSARWFIMDRPDRGPADAETIAQWCSRNGAEVIRDENYFALDLSNGGGWVMRDGEVLRSSGRWERIDDPIGWFATKLRYANVPDHVADAMVREARRALGEGS